jgi:hypothetical protein
MMVDIDVVDNSSSFVIVAVAATGVVFVVAIP